jgi:hypothetical protein
VIWSDAATATDDGYTPIHRGLGSCGEGFRRQVAETPIRVLPVATENSIRPGMIAKCRIVSLSSRMLGMIELLLDWLASLVKSRRRL